MNERISRQDRPAIAQGLRAIGVCLLELGRTDDALKESQAALAMNRRLFPYDNRNTAACLDDLGQCFSRQGRHDQALPLFREALAMEQRLTRNKDHRNVASALYQLSMELATANQLDKALPMCKDAMAMDERLRDPDVYVRAYGLGKILLARDDPQNASKAFEKSIDTLEEVRTNMGGDDQDRMGFMSSILETVDPFGGMVRAELELNHADTAA